MHRSTNFTIMYRLIPFTTTILIFCLSLNSCKSVGEKKTFTLQLEQGKQMNSRVAMDANASIRAIGDVDLDLKVTADLQYVPGKTVDKSTPIELTLTNMDGNFHMHQGIIQSADIPSDQDYDFSNITDKYEGKPVTLLMNEQAQVTGIANLDEILGDEGMDSLKSMTANAEALLGENFFERLIAFTAVLPDKPVAIGDKWNHIINQEIFGLPVKLEATYTYKSSENGIAHFDIDADFEMDTLSIDNANIELPIQGLPFKADNIKVLLRGTQSGFIKVNETTGWSNSSDLEQKFKIEFRLGAVTIPASLTNSISIRPAD
jgi:hypothetical protein